MFNFWRFGRALGLTIGAAASLAGVGAVVALRRPLPRSNGSLTIQGLRGAVRIMRDRWGIPHIYAGTSEDLFAALGYVHAQDRLWQMDLNRRTGHGQLAEIFGPVALSSDRFVRTLGFSRVVRCEIELLDDESRSVVEAYVAGINAFLATSQGRLPLEFSLLGYAPRPWEVADVLVWAKMMALTLSENWTTELLNARIVALVGPERARELIPRYPDDQPLAVPAGISYGPLVGEGALRAAAAAAPFVGELNSGQGSNAWVVSGQRSVSGKPLLADDPHLNLTLPSVWYEAHLEGGDYAVAGATFPGTPGVVIGHNARIAWGVTNGMIDVQDLYVERFHPDDPLRYEWQAGWEQAELVREEIRVKGQAEPVIEEVRITRHGPIIDTIAAPDNSPLLSKNGEPRTGLALRWTALDPSPRVLQAVLGLNRARCWDEFRAAIADWRVPPQNFVYADVDGHYGYALGGDIPIRGGYDGRLPVPGWSGAYEWQGMIPAAAMPAAFDPPAGLAVTANNRIAGKAYPYYEALAGEWLNGYRAARIQALLDATVRHSAHSFAHIQRDVRSLPGLELARLVAGLQLADPLERQARDLLVAWDGELGPDSVGGAIYEALRYHLSQRAYAELGDLRAAPAALGAFGSIPGNAYLERAVPAILARIAAAEAPDRADPWLGEGRTWNSVMGEALALAVAELCQRMGNDPRLWRYGRVHGLTLRHPLGSIPALARIFNRGPWPVGGDVDTVCQGYAPRQTAAGPVFTAPSYRQICDTGDWDASLSVYPGGQSGHPASAHYANQAHLWRRTEYHPMLWSRARVEEHTVSTLVLKPAAG